MTRFLALIYGMACYVFFLGLFMYTIGFVTNVFVPKGIDTGVAGDRLASFVIDASLLGLFAVQHSVMARPGFKQFWTRVIPPPIERSTYVLATNLVLVLLYWQWRPLPEPVWDVAVPALRYAVWAVGGLGWLVVFLSTFLINHFDLFGVRQVLMYFLGRPDEPPVFKVRAFYRFVRHPLMTGFLIAFWVTPTMSAGHLLFAAMTTIYILAAIQLEERDLVVYFGDAYRAYQGEVGMLVPAFRRRR